MVVTARTTTTYLLRDVPGALYAAVKSRAKSEGRSVRLVVLELFQMYVNHGLPPREDFTTQEQ